MRLVWDDFGGRVCMAAELRRREDCGCGRWVGGGGRVWVMEGSTCTRSNAASPRAATPGNLRAYGGRGESRRAFSFWLDLVLLVVEALRETGWLREAIRSIF